MGKPAGRTVVLTSNLPKPVNIVGIGHSFGDYAKADLKVIEPGRIYEISLTTTATQRLNYPGHITLDLAGAPVPQFFVDAFIQVKE